MSFSFALPCVKDTRNLMEVKEKWHESMSSLDRSFYFQFVFRCAVMSLVHENVYLSVAFDIPCQWSASATEWTVWSLCACVCFIFLYFFTFICTYLLVYPFIWFLVFVLDFKAFVLRRFVCSISLEIPLWPTIGRFLFRVPVKYQHWKWRYFQCTILFFFFFFFFVSFRWWIIITVTV